MLGPVDRLGRGGRGFKLLTAARANLLLIKWLISSPYILGLFDQLRAMKCLSHSIIG
jgi:hypothetical protein